MRTGLLRSLVWSLAAMTGGVSAALADSATANCEVSDKGEARPGASGPCTFSQRQGHINLDLRNGDSYSLLPTDEPSEYRDQEGNRVVRTLSGGGPEEFEWQGGRKIVMTYPGQSAARVAAPAAGAGTGGRPDSFDTVCGVIVDGRTYRYRCGATDFYTGSQKVSTELRYPDQTIQLTWRAGNRVGLQFEGMVPKEATYATYEGETNFVFEGKTYFYWSNKELARMEWEQLRD